LLVGIGLFESRFDQAGHPNVRISKPDGPGVISASMVIVWHAGQGGRRIIMMLALDQAGALQNSQSPVDAERVGDQATMDPPKFERCSILLTFQS
jgi:hypothetical protein